MPTTTDRTERLARAANRRKARLSADLPTHDESKPLANLSSAALAIVAQTCAGEARRIPTSLSAVCSADDLTTETLLTLTETPKGRAALASLSLDLSSVTSEARAVVRMVAKRGASNLLRRESVAKRADETIRRHAQVTAVALTSTATGAMRGRSESEQASVLAAIEADGPSDRIDRDHQRSYALSDASAKGWQQGRSQATAAGIGHAGALDAAAMAEHAAHRGERRAMRAMREQTTAREVRIVRGADLESLLTQQLRIGGLHAEQGDTAGRTLASVLSGHEGRFARAAFRATFAASLDTLTLVGSGRGARVLRAVADDLASLTTDDASDRATEYQQAAQATREHADALAALAPSKRRGLSNVERAALDAAAAAAAAADRADRLAALATTLAETRATRPLRLADVVWASVTSAADEGRRTGGARARADKGQASDASTLDNVSACAFLGWHDATSNGPRCYLATVRMACERALDATSDAL
jgi:hypothetical protein